MSFLTDLFSGNISNLGNDLAPSNIFSDTVQDIGGSNTIPEILGVAGLGLGGLGLLGGLGGLGAAAGAGAADASLGAATSAADWGADLSTLGPGFADTSDLAALPAGATLDAGTIPTSLASTASAAWPQTLDLGAPGAGATTGAAPLDLTATAAAPSVGTLSVPGEAPVALSAGDITNDAGIDPAAQGGLWNTISNTLAPVGNAIKTVAPIAGLAGLGYNLYSGYEQKQQLNTLNKQEAQSAATEAGIASTEQAAANPLLASGTTLQQYLTTNTLPPQFQTQVTQAVDAAKAQIIQGYASRGMSTDPTQNSALAQDLANADQRGLTLQANLESTLATAGGQMITEANQLLQSGASATDIAAQIPIAMQELDSTLNAQTAQAIANFAAALGGRSPNNPNGITITLPQNIATSTGGLNLGG